MASINRRGKYWRVQIRRQGYPYLSATFDTKAEATAWAFKKEAELDRQTPAEVCQRLEARHYRLADALLRYEMDVLPDKKPTTQKRELGIMADLKATFGDLALLEISGQRLALMVKHWERPSEAHPKGLGPHSIRLYLALISHLYTIARSEWGMADLVNPVPLVRKPKLPRGRDRRLAGDEEERLLAVCEGTNPELADIVRFAIETAMRQAEIMNLTWDRVDFRNHTVFLQDTKNGESRLVPLSVAAEECLKRQRERRGTDPKGRVWGYTTDGMRASYFKALKKANIDGLTFHDLRHEATSRLCERGLPIMTVQAITGHKSTQMLKRYTHISPGALVAAVRGGQ
ncbi:tyrosine-type recombinase/integrase [Acidithiobacillus sp.]